MTAASQSVLGCRILSRAGHTQTLLNEREVGAIFDFLVCAEWAEADEMEHDRNSEWSDEAIDGATRVMVKFMKDAGGLLDDIGDESIGHNTWLTAGGHGTGWWDRGLPDEVADPLCALCEKIGTIDFYEENGRMYLDGYAVWEPERQARLDAAYAEIAKKYAEKN